MLLISYTGKFKKDVKRCKKRNWDMDKLKTIIADLAVPRPLPKENYDHDLKGNFNGRRECHIEPDWLLMYVQTETELILERTGSHAGLFKN